MLEDRSKELVELFNYSHLKGELQEISKKFHDLAIDLDKNLKPGLQKFFCLHQLLLSKDSAVRSKVQERV